ncbi:MAG: MFS transporter [Treponema sp.]|nr:MFS transporter [Treponema sp.]
MKSWKANFTALLIAQTLAMVGFGLSTPVIPLFLEEDLGLTDPVRLKIWVGLIQASASVMLAIFAPIWGHMADMFSRRAMLLRAMFGGALIISLMTFVNAPWQLLALKGIQGCLTGTVAAATVMTAGFTPAAEVAFALGLLQTGIATGNSLGPLIGGVLSDFLGHRAAFFGTGVTLALAGLIVLKWVENDRQPKIEKQDKKFRLFPDIKPIVNNPLLLSLMFVTFGVQAANGTAGPMLPLFLKSLVADTAEQQMYIGSSTGLVLGVGAATSALAAVIMGKNALRFGYWRSLIFCLTACAISTIPQAFVTNMYQLMTLRAVSSFFLGGTSPVISAIIATSADKKSQGTAFGFNSSISSAGAALGPMIGSAAAMLSYRAVFTVSAVILLMATLTIISRQRKIASK